MSPAEEKDGEVGWRCGGGTQRQRTDTTKTENVIGVSVSLLLAQTDMVEQ